MNRLLIGKVTKYVSDNIGIFHEKRINRINQIKLSQILRRKNPYLFKAKNLLTAEGIVTGLVDAHLSSNEETIFGDWLEGLAVFVTQEVHNGWKSGIPGMDIELDKGEYRYILAIKSGPNWGNSSQIKKMRSDFNSARKTLRTSNSKVKIIAINGCCYGRDNNPDKGDYYKLCGQHFWTFISDEECLYTDIIEPLGTNAKAKNDDFLQSYSNLINRFTFEFSSEYCLQNGEIDWERLVKFNSEMKRKPIDI